MKILGMECPGCKSLLENVKEEGGELVCQNCGLNLGTELNSEYQSKPDYFNRIPSREREEPTAPTHSNRIADWIAWKLSGRMLGRKYKKKKKE